MLHIDLFSGIGGFAYAAREVWGQDYRNLFFCDNNKFCQAVIRKNFGRDSLIYGDIKDLHIWDIDKNDGMCYSGLCYQKENSKLISEILFSLLKQNLDGEWSLYVKIAESTCPFLHALQEMVEENFAQMLADINSSVGKMRPTPGAGNGCADQGILIGKTGNAKTEETIDLNTKKQSNANGAGLSMPEINIPAKNAEMPEEKISMPTIFSHGQNIQKEDLIYQMELLYAKNATRKFICERKRARADLLTAGFPCQPASCAGKRKGRQDDRWLWPETIRIVREGMPTWCIFENVRGLITLERGMALEQVFLDLESIGYAVQAFIIPACAVNAPHRRDRVWIVARLIENSVNCGNGRGSNGDQAGLRRPLQTEGSDRHAADAESRRCGDGITEDIKQDSEQINSLGYTYGLSIGWQQNWLEVATRLCRVDDGLPAIMDGVTISKSKHREERLKALGNAIVPQVAIEIMKAIRDSDKEFK